MKLNICCADRLKEGYLNVDIVVPKAPLGRIPGGLPGFDFQQVNLNGPWPWSDSSITEVHAYDAIEHLPNHIHTMNEAWRVLEPGGVFDIDVPTTDGRAAWQDPTHVSFWNRNSFWYYKDGNPHRERFGVAYGVKARFRVLDEKSMMGPVDVFGPGFTKLHIVMEAVKEGKLHD